MQIGPQSALPLTYAPAPTRVRYGVLGFLCILAFLTYFDRVCIASAQSDIQRDLHITASQMGLIFGAFWLAYGLFEIPAGWLGDRFGSRRALAGVALAWSVFTALSGAATGFVSLISYRFLFGVGEAGAYPNMAQVQSRWFPPRMQARAGGVLWLVSRWGGALSYILFPALLASIGSQSFRQFLTNVPGLHGLAHIPAWRIAFWICGLAGVVWVACFFPWFRDEPAQKASVNDSERQLIQSGRAADGQKHSHFDLHTLGLLLRNPSLWGIALAYTGTSFGWSFLVSWMNEFLSKVHHVSYSGSPAMKSLPMLTGGVACLLGGALSDWYVRRSGRRRFGRVIFPIVGSAVAAAAMASIPLTHSAPQAMTLVCLASIASDMGQAPSWASIISVGGKYAGTAFGFVNMIANGAGNFLAPVVCPRVVEHFGWNVMMCVYASAFLLATVMWILINPNRRFYEEPSADNSDT